MPIIRSKYWSKDTKQLIKQAYKGGKITKKDLRLLKQLALSNKKALVALKVCAKQEIKGEKLESFFNSLALVDDDKIEAIEMGYDNKVPMDAMEFLAKHSKELSNVRMMILQIGFAQKNLSVNDVEKYCMTPDIEDWRVEVVIDALNRNVSEDLIYDIRDNAANRKQAIERINIANHYKRQSMDADDIKTLFGYYDIDMPENYKQEFINAISFGLGKEPDTMNLLYDCYKIGMSPEQIRELRLGLQTKFRNKDNKIEIKTKRLNRADARILMNPKLSPDRLRYLRMTITKMGAGNRDIIKRLANPEISDDVAICLCPLLLQAKNEKQLGLINTILDAQLDETQAAVIKSAFMQGMSLDKIGKLVSANYNAKQMNEIKKALQDERINDADVNEFANPTKGFDWKQMRQLRLAIQDGLPFGVRTVIANGISVKNDKGEIEYTQIDASQMEQVRLFAKNGYVPPALFQDLINENYSGEQLKWVRKAFEMGSVRDMSAVRSNFPKTLNSDQMKQVTYALNDNITEKKNEKLKMLVGGTLDADRMKVLRECFSKKVDMDGLSLVANQSYTTEQAKNIAYALKGGLSTKDVRKIANENFSHEKMQFMIFALKSGQCSEQQIQLLQAADNDKFSIKRIDLLKGLVTSKSPDPEKIKLMLNIDSEIAAIEKTFIQAKTQNNSETEFIINLTKGQERSCEDLALLSSKVSRDVKQVMEVALRHNVPAKNMSWLVRRGLNDEQSKVAITGLIKGLAPEQVAMFTKPNITAEVMQGIADGLLEGKTLDEIKEEMIAAAEMEVYEPSVPETPEITSHTTYDDER